MEVLNELGPKVDELIHELSTLPVAGSGNFVLSNYIFWMLVSTVLLIVIMYVAVKRIEMVPTSRLANGVEFLADFVRSDMVGGMLSPESTRKYFPFIGSLFFFILINNIVGLIPGCKPGTGTMGVTVALATIVFVFFNAVGIKNQGVWGYIKSFSPKGIMPGVNVLVWAIEIVSAFLRIFTLSVRLFANMYAGHIILGIFAILTSLFAQAAINEFTAAHLVGALPSIAWMALLVALYLLEVLVAFVQAYVFTILTTVYINLAEHAH